MPRSLTRTFFVYWVPVCLYLTLLRSLSSQSEIQPPSFFSSDKLYHVAAFLILGFLWARAVFPLFDLSPRALVWVAFWGSFLYGVIEEFVIQAATPGRFPSWGDLVADGVGALLGGWLFVRWRRWRPTAFI